MQADSFGQKGKVQEHAGSPIRRLARAAAILALAVAPYLAAADSWTDANCFTWSYSVDNGDATITGVSPAKGDITIPASIGNNRVTRIGEGAFFSCSGLTSVTIPDSVTSIGDRAFSDCRGLTGVTIGNGVTRIGDFAFADCSGLTDVTIPASVTSIGSDAFAWCYNVREACLPGVRCGLPLDNLTNLVISDGTTSIEAGAFEGCAGLESVTIPASVTSIGVNAFCRCSNLTDFSVDPQNGFYMFKDGLLLTKDGKTLVEGINSQGNITIPAGVTSIGDCAFSGCSGLTGATIGRSEERRAGNECRYRWTPYH